MKPSRSFAGRTNKGLTLIELIFSLILLPLIFFSIYYLGTFALEKVALYSARHEMYAQIDYALADLEQRMPSAASVDPASLFPAGKKGEEDQYSFRRDNVLYTYKIDANNDLVWESSDGSRDVLIKSKFSPQIIFKREENDEPNFLTVEIRITNNSSHIKGLARSIYKKTGIRMIFTDIVKAG